MLPSSWESGAVLCGDTARGEPGSILPSVSFLVAVGMGKDTFMDVEEGRRGQQGCKGSGLGVLGAVDATGGCWVDGSSVGPCPLNYLGLSPGWVSPALGKDRATLLGTAQSAGVLVGP